MFSLLPLLPSASGGRLRAGTRPALRRMVLPALVLAGGAALSGCSMLGAGVETRSMVVTAYCDCGECNSYSRGSWKFLKLDFWNRTVNAGPDKGREYTGKTAAGENLAAPRPGLFSADSVQRPWMIPVRTALPWCILPRDGSIAADTNYYPFGTRMYVPGWGWGVVTDRGGAIKGPERIDIFFPRHAQTERWGRQRLDVRIQAP